MNRAQRVVILIGLLVMAPMGIYWPWYDATALLWSPVSTDYYSLFALPDRNHAPNIPQLFAQLAVVAGLTIGLAVWLRRRRDVVNRAQLAALLVAALAILLMGVFPPWLADTEPHPGEEMVFAGYHGPLTPPHKVYHPQWGVEPLGYGRVHAPLLALQWLLVGALTAALVVGLGSRRPSPTGDERSAGAALRRAQRPAIVVGLLAVAAAVLLGVFAVQRSGEARLPPAPATRQLHQRGPIPVRASFGVFLPEVEVTDVSTSVVEVGRWSPDGRWLLARDDHQCLVKVDRAGKPVRLYSPERGWEVGAVDRATWTEGGRRIWFTVLPPSCDDPGRELSVGDDGRGIRPCRWGLVAADGSTRFVSDIVGDDPREHVFKFFRREALTPSRTVRYTESMEGHVATHDFFWLPDNSGVVWFRSLTLPPHPSAPVLSVPKRDLRIVDIATKSVLEPLPKGHYIHSACPLPGGGLWVRLDSDPDLGLDESFVHTAIWRRGEKRLEVRSYNLLELGLPERIWRLVPSPNQDYLLVYYQPEDGDPALYALNWEGTRLQWICDGMLPYDLYPIAPDGSAFVFQYPRRENDTGPSKYGIASIGQHSSQLE